MNDTAWLRIENRHTGEILNLRRVRTPDGEILQLRGSLPPRGEGPPLHLHDVEREEGTVTRGRLGVHVGGEEHTIDVGGSAAFPPGVLHRWWNAGDEPLEFEGVTRPAGDLDRYLQGVFAAMNAGTPERPNLFYMAHVLHRHRDTQFAALMPRGLQRVLFPVVIAIGTVLGKYRGNAWPGAPGECRGAPVVDAE